MVFTWWNILCAALKNSISQWLPFCSALSSLQPLCAPRSAILWEPTRTRRFRMLLLNSPPLLLLLQFQNFCTDPWSHSISRNVLVNFLWEKVERLCKLRRTASPVLHAAGYWTWSTACSNGSMSPSTSISSPSSLFSPRCSRSTTFWIFEHKIKKNFQ